jgi:phage shock protein C
MQATQSNTLFREDTMLGVCEALGQDFGFNPIFLRIGLGVSLLWNPVAVIGVYLGLGVIVALSRLAVPNTPHRWFRRKPAAPVQDAAPETIDDQLPEVALAA